MKCKFQQSFVKSNGDEIWSGLKQVEVKDLSSECLFVRQKGRAYYSSIQLYDGNVAYYPFLFIDIDSKDLEKSYQATISLARSLGEKGLIYDEDFYIAFSGSKGFHILLSTKAIFGFMPDGELFTPKSQKAFVNALFRDLNSEYADLLDDSIFGTHRMIRLDHSVNNKSGLYKTPLTQEELLGGIDSIKTTSTFRYKTEIPFFEKFNTERPLNSYLAEIFAQVNENKIEIEVGKNEIKVDSAKSGIKKPKVHKINNANAYDVQNSCRALRQLTFDIVSTGEATHDQRLALATSLYETDYRENLVHDILSKTEKYQRSVTESKMAGINSIRTCANLIENGICKNPCERFQTKELQRSPYPGHLGHYSLKWDAWGYIVSAENIKRVYDKLMVYHRTTTDFFNWANARQFGANKDLYSLAISDYLKKGLLPDTNGILVKVAKDGEKTRDLVRIDFESELSSSLFCEKALESNIRFKNERARGYNIHSFGYLTGDSSGLSLIGSWRDEYQDYKRTLKEVAAKTPHKIVFSTDIRDFYPSISSEKTKLILEEIFKDSRIVNLLSGFFRPNLKNFRDGSDVKSEIGLSQGPLISHIVAARLLLNIDKEIKDSFEKDDIQVVRYCDDFVFFVKDEDVYSKLAANVLPKIEATYGLMFHLEGKSDKVKKHDIETYRENHLDEDLFKYQIRFEAELSKIDKEEKRELLRVINSIFDSRLQKYFAGDVGVNLKELERDLLAMQWRVPDLISDGGSFRDEILLLTQTLKRFLDQPTISHKLRMNLSSLITGIAVALRTEVREVEEIYFDMYSNGLRECHEAILTVLVRELCVDGSKRIKEFAHDILNLEIKGKRVTSNLYEMLRSETRYLVSSGNDFNFEIWPTSVGLQNKNLSRLVQDLYSVEVSPKSFGEICKSIDTLFPFYLKHFRDRVFASHATLTVSEKYEYFKVGYLYNLFPIKEMFLPDYKEFVRAGIIKENEAGYFDHYISRLKALIYESTNENPDSVEIVMSHADVKTIFNGKDYFMVSFPRNSDYLKASKKRLSKVVKDLNSIRGIGELFIKASPDSNDVGLLYKLPRVPSFDVVDYLDPSNDFADILDAEKRFFDQQTHFPSGVVLAAKNLGLCKDGSLKRLVILDFEGVIKDTLNGTYSFGDSTCISLKKRGRSLLPGRRLAEINDSRGISDASEFPLGYASWEILRILKDGNRASFFFKQPKDISQKIQAVLNYGRWLNQSLSNIELDKLNSYAYSIVRATYKQHKKIRMRSKTSSSSFYSYNLFYPLQKILTNEHVGLSIYRYIKTEVEKEKNFKTNSLPSIDLIVGYSLLWSAVNLIKRHKGIHRPSITAIGIVGAIQIRNSLEELKERFEFASSDRENVDRKVTVFFGSLNLLLRTNFISPDFSNGEEYLDAVLRDGNSIVELLREIDFKKIKLRKVHQLVAVDPPFSEDQVVKMREISSKFSDTLLRISVVPSKRVHFLKISGFERFEEYLRVEEEGFAAERFSRLHSWGLETDKLISQYGYVATDGKQSIISCYPKDFNFYPSGLGWKRLNRRELYTYAIAGSGAVAIVTSYSSEIWMFCSGILGFS